MRARVEVRNLYVVSQGRGKRDLGETACCNGECNQTGLGWAVNEPVLSVLSWKAGFACWCAC